MKNTHPEAVLIGEVWEDASNKISYGKLREYFLGNELDSTMNSILFEIVAFVLFSDKVIQDPFIKR